MAPAGHMYSRGWTRECSESLQRRPALYVQDASSMGESRSLGRPEKAERRVAGETREHESEDLQKHAAQVRHDAGKRLRQGKRGPLPQCFYYFRIKKGRLDHETNDRGDPCAVHGAVQHPGRSSGKF